MPETTMPKTPNRVPFDPAWRSNTRWKRAFYARYMKWLEVFGFIVVFAIIGGFIFAFNYKVDDVVKAEGVTWELAGSDVLAPTEITIVRWLVEPGLKVTSGIPIAQYIEGTFSAEWLARADMSSEGVKILTASVTGTLVVVEPLNIAEGETVARIVDPSKVTVSATVTGDTVAKAAPGQTARLRDISIGDGPIVVRIDTNGHKVISRLLLSDFELPDTGTTAIQVAGDTPLNIKEIKSAEVDVKGSWTPESGTGVVTNPAPDQVVTGEVASVTPLATVQFADMPESWRSEFLQQLTAATSNQLVRDAQGNTGRVADLSDLRIVLQMRMSGQSSTTNVIPGAKVDRSSEAQIIISDAPAAVLQALLEGKKVTSKLEVVTGTRPIAFILLKRS